MGSGLLIGPKQTLLDWFFQRNDYIAPKILETGAEIRDANKKIGGEMESKSAGEREKCSSGISEMDAIAGAGGS